MSNDHARRSAPAAAGELPDLTKILPPVEWLTPEQRRLWHQRTAAYLAAGLPRPAAEQEAMAELVMTGKLCRREFERTELGDSAAQP